MKRLFVSVLVVLAACGGGSGDDGSDDDGSPAVSGAVKLRIRQAEHGRITATPDGPYDVGAVVTLRAAPDDGYGFGGWIGIAETTNPVTITLDEDASVSASFIRDAVSLGVTVEPAVGGSVDADPPPPYAKGAVVTLTAMAEYGYAFSGWQGASGSGETATITLTSNTSVTAQFSRVPATLTTTQTYPTGGTLTVSPPGPHFVGDTVTVSFSASDGFIFDGWSDGSNETSRAVTLDGDVTLNARMTAVPFIRGAATHTGNDTIYPIPFGYAGGGQFGVTGYDIQESYNDGPFVSLAPVSTTLTAGNFTITINRDPGKQCYRVRARIGGGGAYSPFGNTICMQRLPGPKQIRIVNDLQSLVLDNFEYNDVISVRAAAGDPTNAVNRLSTLQVINTGGEARTFSMSGLPDNYQVKIGTGRWEQFCPTQTCSWSTHHATVMACNGTKQIPKERTLNITEHAYDTLTLYTSYWLPYSSFGTCIGGSCVQDPVCSH